MPVRGGKRWNVKCKMTANKYKGKSEPLTGVRLIHQIKLSLFLYRTNLLNYIIFKTLNVPSLENYLMDKVFSLETLLNPFSIDAIVLTDNIYSGSLSWTAAINVSAILLSLQVFWPVSLRWSSMIHLVHFETIHVCEDLRRRYPLPTVPYKLQTFSNNAKTYTIWNMIYSSKRRSFLFDYHILLYLLNKNLEANLKHRLRGLILSL